MKLKTKIKLFLGTVAGLYYGSYLLLFLIII